MTPKQPWLKAMENGALGEARAKALLLERFWVLERSVDIDGADYLIQRRITKNTFLDRTPPCLGVVQVKFLQDEKTYARIRKEYICNAHGNPHTEFFALIFIGHEDLQRSFLYSAADLLRCFSEVPHEGLTYLQGSGADILTNRNNEILDIKSPLDKIELALSSADFFKNRQFLGSSDYFKIEPGQIAPDYAIPLDNSVCNLVDSYYDLRQNLQHTKFEIEEILEAVSEVLKEPDPLKAVDVFQEKVRPYVGGGGYHRDSIIIGLKEPFDDEDFVSTAKAHITRINALRALRIESPFFALVSNYTKMVISKTLDLHPLSDNAILVEAVYDSKTLADLHVSVQLHAGFTSTHILSSELGKQRIVYIPSHWIPFDHKGKETKKREPSTRDEFFRCYNERVFLIARPFQKEVEGLLIGHDLVDDWLQT